MASSSDSMSPDASPGGGSGARRGLISGVRRVNNVPVYIVIGLVALFLIVVIAVIIDRSNQNVASDPTLQSKKAASTLDMANQVAGTTQGGEVAAAPVVPTPPAIPGQPTALPPATPPVDANGVPIAPVDPNVPPMPPGGSAGNGAPPPENPAVSSRRQRIEEMRTMKMQQFSDAVKAPTNIRMAAARSAGSPPSGNGANADTTAKLEALRQQIAAETAQGNAPSQDALAQLAALQGQAGGGGGNAQPATPPNSLGQFGNREGGDRWRLNSAPQAPRSRFELRAGFVVPGTLISGINSELPGQIVAQVSQNVFDTATGKFLLIPQGARLVGSYSAQVAYGQSRVLIAWQRIVFPDGKAMDIDAMPGSDSAGYAGFKDKVNNHYLRIFASALIMSGIIAGAEISQPQVVTNNGVLSPQQSATAAFGQELSQVSGELIRKNLSIAPTLMIRPGFRFNVVVTKDLTFSKPYRSFDY